MRILIAPNAFKHSLNAEAVAEAINIGLRRSHLSCQCQCFPIGDGGDGTAHLINKKCNADIVAVAVNDPLGRKINTLFGLIDNGNTAVIEMADASGIRLLRKEELNPMLATSFGTGEQIKAALDKGVNKIILGMGGSATVDGGTGILRALGIKFLDNKEQELVHPKDLIHLHYVDVSGVDKRINDCELIVLCDVDNLLLGSNGAAAMFGPQKGARPDDVYKLNEALALLSEIGLKQTGKNMATTKYGGTAGGAAAGLYAFLNATLVNGIDYFLDLTGFDQAIENTDLIITGEGSIDEQTLQGKGPYGVAYRAKQKGIAVIALAGKVPLNADNTLRQYFDVLLPISNEPLELSEALKHTRENLIRTSEEVGNLLSLGIKR